MIGVFPPAVSLVLDSILGLARGACASQAVQDAVTGALQWNRRARALYDYWKTSSVSKEPELATIQQRIELYFTAREDTLRAMAADCAQDDLPALMEKVKDLKESTMALTDLLLAFRKHNGRHHAYSSVPTVDEFIKTGINVFNEVYPPDALKQKFPTLLALKRDFDVDVSLFEKYFPGEKELTEALKKDLYYLEQSIGAVYTFLEEGGKGDLLTGLKALGVASSKIASDLAETAKVRTAKGLSSNPMIDEFIKEALARAQGKAAAEEYARALTGIETYLQNTWGDMQRFFGNFFVRRPVGEKYYAVFAGQVRTLEETLTALRDAQPRELLDTFKKTFEDLLATRGRFYREALVEPDLSRDLDIEELREVMKAVKDGVLHAGALEEKFARLAKRCADAVRKLEFLPDYDELTGLREVLARQQKAYESIGAWFIDRNPMRLLVGLEEMEGNFTAYLDGEAKLEGFMKFVNWVVCGNCGHSNFPDERACTECRTPLPEPGRYQDGYLDLRMTKDDEVYHSGDMSGVSSEGLKLKKTVEGFFNGEVAAEQLKDYLDYLRGKVYTIKTQFNQRVAPALRQNPGDATLQEMGQEFQAIFHTFDEALDEMFLYFDDHDPVHLKEGMMAVLQSDHALLQLNQGVQQVLQAQSVS